MKLRPYYGTLQNCYWPSLGHDPEEVQKLRYTIIIIVVIVVTCQTHTLVKSITLHDVFGAVYQDTATRQQQQLCISSASHWLCLQFHWLVSRPTGALVRFYLSESSYPYKTIVGFSLVLVHVRQPLLQLICQFVAFGRRTQHYWFRF